MKFEREKGLNILDRRKRKKKKREAITEQYGAKVYNYPIIVFFT